MNLATSRLINEFDNEVMNQMTKAEYNQFICGFYHNMTPSEAELEYFKMEEEQEKFYEKLY